MKTALMTPRMREKREEIKRSIRQMSSEECSWLAGVIDGEGSLGLYNYGREGRRVQILVINTNEAFVAHARALVGTGSSVMRCYYTSKLAKFPRKLPIYQWALKGSIRCVEVLKQIVPYLIIKKALALSIIEEIERNPFGRWVNTTPIDRVLQANICRVSWEDPIIRRKRLDGMARARIATSLVKEVMPL